MTTIIFYHISILRLFYQIKFLPSNFVSTKLKFQKARLCRFSNKLNFNESMKTRSAFYYLYCQTENRLISRRIVGSFSFHVEPNGLLIFAILHSPYFPFPCVPLFPRNVVFMLLVLFISINSSFSPCFPHSPFFHIPHVPYVPYSPQFHPLSCSSSCPRCFLNPPFFCMCIM